YRLDADREGDGGPHPRRVSDERKDGAAGSRLSRADARPEHLRHEECEVDPLDRSCELRLHRLLAAAGLVRQRERQHERADRSAGAERAVERRHRAGRRYRIRGSARDLEGRTFERWREVMGPSRPRDADGAALVAPLELRLDSERSRTREADRQGDGRNREYRDADRALALSRRLDRIRLHRRDRAARIVPSPPTKAPRTHGYPKIGSRLMSIKSGLAVASSSSN